MANLLCRLEGTWQEIAERIPDFDTRKLEVIVYDAEEIPPMPAEADDPRVAIIDAIAAATREMNLAPDTRDYLRERRDGGMFDDNPVGLNRLRTPVKAKSL